MMGACACGCAVGKRREEEERESLQSPRKQSGGRGTFYGWRRPDPRRVEPAWRIRCVKGMASGWWVVGGRIVGSGEQGEDSGERISGSREWV